MKCGCGERKERERYFVVPRIAVQRKKDQGTVWAISERDLIAVSVCDVRELAVEDCHVVGACHSRPRR